MARQSNAAYWAQRFKNMEAALLDRSYTYVENLEAQFNAAQAEVEKQIALWYQRFADNNEITLADAKRLLTKGELAEFKWSVAEYIAYGQQNALDGAWMKQLENASARVHISRLEAIKLQLQQQAELLYSNQLDYIDRAARQMYEGSYYHTAFEVQRGLGVGWTMHAINENTITKVLSRPWTADNQTFRDRCWTNKQSLVNAVNTQLTQMIIRGEAPDRAISAITHQFGVARSKAGRLVMTESAYFASVGQKDCYGALGVEHYQIVASFDHETCGLCADMDGKVFKVSEYQPGLTANPFHPWCRCCTCPYFEDVADLGRRFVRNPDGTTDHIPARTSFEEWKKGFVQQTAPAPLRVAPAVKSPLIDVVNEYRKTATPGQGAVEYDAGYKPGKHQEEIKIANWLHDTYGGDIRLLNEADEFGVKMPDFEWRGRLWELKTTSTANATDNAVRKAIKQIQDNPGGIILDYGDRDIDIDALLSVIGKRVVRCDLKSFDILILSRGKAVKVLRHKK